MPINKCNIYNHIFNKSQNNESTKSKNSQSKIAESRQMLNIQQPGINYQAQNNNYSGLNIMA